MAAGSQLENGIWALLVVAASITNQTNRLVWGDRIIEVILAEGRLTRRARAIRISESPTRLDRAVNRPAPMADGVG